MKPILHMGLGWDEFHLRALVNAGFETRDVVLVARTNANLVWARRSAPGAEVVMLPYARSLRQNPVTGTTPTKEFRLAASSAGMEPWDVVMGERSLRRRPADVAAAFANGTARTLAEVVKETGPTIAIAEFTVTSEIILSGLVAAAGGIPFWPRTLRHPSDRFGLFSVPRGVTQLPRPGQSGTDAEAATRLQQAIDGTAPPSYFAQNSRVEGVREVVRLATDRVDEYVRDRGQNLQLPQPVDYLRLPWLNVLKGRRNLATYRSRSWDELDDRPFVLFPLHVQPESTVDVMAPEWRDQAYAALRLADALAEQGMALVVKEHSNFIWRRDPSFWDEIDQHPNIVCVDPSVDSKSLIERAEWVFTPTGTAGLEAALRGSRVVMGARMAWTALPNVRCVPTLDDVDAFIRARGWEELHADADATERWWREEYLANSYDGVALDPPRFPGVMVPDNLQKFGVAYAEIASTLS